MKTLDNPTGPVVTPITPEGGGRKAWGDIWPMTTRSERKRRPSGKSPTKRIHVLNWATVGIDPRDGETPMPDFKGYALCGAGKPSSEYPYGSTQWLDPMLRKYRNGVTITCYRCLKLMALNQGDELYLRQFPPTDRQGTELRRSHIMLPEGRSGLYGADTSRPEGAPEDAPMDPQDSSWVIGPPIARTQSRAKVPMVDSATGRRPAVNEFFGINMPELKIGDYVDERGRIGQVTALHTKGTADIQFEDLEYPIRRQVRNLQKVELNPKRGGVLYEVYDPTRAQFNAQVQAIYESLVRRHLRKKSTVSFKPRGKRLDSNMRKATIRKLLGDAFQIATGVGQKHGYLKKGTNVATKKGKSRSAARQDDYQHLMDNILDYETTLSMARQDPYRVVEMKRGRQSRYYIMPSMRYRLKADVAIEDVKTMNQDARKKISRKKTAKKLAKEVAPKRKRLRNPKKPKVKLQDSFTRARTGRTPSQDLTQLRIIPDEVPLYHPDDIADEGGFVREDVEPIGYYWDYIIVGPAYIFQGRRSFSQKAKSREQTQAIIQGLRNTNFGANSFRMREVIQEDYTNPTIAQVLLDQWSSKIIDIHGPITDDERKAMEAIVRANQIARTVPSGYYSQPNYFLAFAEFVKLKDPSMIKEGAQGPQVIARRDLLEKFDRAWMDLYDPTRMLKTSDWKKNLKPRVRGSCFEVGYIPESQVPSALVDDPNIPADLQFIIPEFERFYDPEKMDEVAREDVLFGKKISYTAYVPKVRQRFSRETTQIAYYEPTYLTANQVDQAIEVALSVSKEGRRTFVRRLSKGLLKPEELFSLTVIQTAKVLRFIIASEALLGRDETRYDYSKILSDSPVTRAAWAYCTQQGLSTKYIIPRSDRQKR